MAAAAEKRPGMTWDDIERAASAEIDEAARFVRDHIAVDRARKWDRYYGRPLGNEKRGKSQFMSRDVMDSIEAVLPSLVRLFASGDPKIEIDIEGQPDWVGKALMRRIQDDLGDDDTQSLFTLLYQWFKDALVSDTAWVKLLWALDYEMVDHRFGELAAEQVAQLTADPEIEMTGAEVVDGFAGPVWRNVTARIKRVRRDQLSCEALPHWEVIYSKRARSMNDEHGKGHVTEVTLDYLRRIDRASGGDFFTGLDDLPAKPTSGSDLTADSSEKAGYMGLQYDFDTTAEASEGPKARVDLVEWYTRLDTDGDGILEDVIVWQANGKMIRWEINDDGFISMCGLSPILDPYKFNGIAFADLIVEIQNLKTMIIRRLLDNWDYQNSGFWLRKPGSTVDIRALLDHVPGDVVEADFDSIQNVAPQAFHPSNLALLEYFETQKEERRGFTRTNQGMMSDSLNKTASGLAMLQSAGQQRIELAARVMAETGLKDFYRKAVMLYQKHTRKPFAARVRGKEVTVEPSMIQGRVKTRVNMGVEAQAGMVEAQKIERMFAWLAQVNQMMPGLIGPEEVYNLATRYVASMGFRQTEDFISNMDQFMAEIQNRMQMAQQAQQQAAQIEQQKTAGEQQVQLEKIRTNERIRAGDRQQRQQGHQVDLALDVAELKQKDRHKEMDLLMALSRGGAA